MGELEAIAQGARRRARQFSVRVRILIPNEGAPPDVLAEDYAERVDRNVAEAESDGVTVYSVQRQYVVPEDVSYNLVEILERGGIGAHASGGVAIGGESARGTAVYGGQARPGFQLEDTDEGRVYDIVGAQYVPGNRNVAILVERERTDA